MKLENLQFYAQEELSMTLLKFFLLTYPNK